MRKIFVAVVATICLGVSGASAAPAEGGVLAALKGGNIQQAQYYGGYGGYSGGYGRRCPYGYYYTCWRDYYGRRVCGCQPRY